ncbi:MAG: signal peptidase I [Erysipelotrichaceae bacterium]|jgi:signal peptidase I|nr:signal peptidase I [Erysipelotrichaceae bacterium]MCI9524786.1 signal peptidase I [Erysipelotrichaceae bacterium]
MRCKQIFYALFYYLCMIIGAYIAVFIFTHVLFTPVYVNGNSMEPNIAEGTIGFSNIATRHISGIQRFDIIVFTHNDEWMIKRVIALPKETIEVKDNTLYIDGMEIEQPFLTEDVLTSDIALIRLSDQEIYVLGDNRNNSMDSRMFGAIHLSDVIGKDLYAMR